MKNFDIIKSPLEINSLPTFNLGVTTTDHAALDFLRLENYIKRTDWIASHLIPPASRVSSGETVPISHITKTGDEITAHIDLTGYAVDLDSLQVSSVFSEGSFVRISECDIDPTRGQRLYQLITNGWTCIIRSIDWQTGVVVLDARPNAHENRYVLPSHTFGNQVFQHATIDSSVSDFVGKTVDEYLTNHPNAPTYEWFNPDPHVFHIPPQTVLNEPTIAGYRTLLSQLVWSNDSRLDANQIDVILSGLNTRIQLIQYCLRRNMEYMRIRIKPFISRCIRVVG